MLSFAIDLEREGLQMCCSVNDYGENVKRYSYDLYHEYVYEYVCMHVCCAYF